MNNIALLISTYDASEDLWCPLKETFQKDQRVEVDEVLKKILAMDKLSRDSNIFEN